MYTSTCIVRSVLDDIRNNTGISKGKSDERNVWILRSYRFSAREERLRSSCCLVFCLRVQQKELYDFEEIFETRISRTTDNKYFSLYFHWFGECTAFSINEIKHACNKKESLKTEINWKLQTFMDGPNASASDIELTCLISITHAR